jgi:hypothetical protein
MPTDESTPDQVAADVAAPPVAWPAPPKAPAAALTTEQLARRVFDRIMIDAYDLLRLPEVEAIRESLPESYKAISQAADALFRAGSLLARESPKDDR